MVTTPENDWSTELKGVPWMQKARPGLRKFREIRQAKDGRPVAVPVTSAQSATSIRSHKQPLSHEAQRTEEAESASAENVFLMIVVVVLLLTMYWGTAAIVLGTASNRRNDAPQIEATVLKKHRAIATDAPESNGQSRATNSKDSGAR